MATIAAERVSNFDELVALAEHGPVRVMDGDREVLIVLSIDMYERLRRGRRQVYATDELPAYMLEALDQTIVELEQEIAATSPSRVAAHL